MIVVPLAKLSAADRRHVASQSQDLKPKRTDVANHGDDSDGKGSIKLEGMKLDGDDAVVILKEPLPSGASAKDLELRILYLQDPHGDSITRIDQVDVSGSATFCAGGAHVGATATLLKNGEPAGFHISYLRVPVVKDSPTTIRAPVDPPRLVNPGGPRLERTGRLFAAILKRTGSNTVEVMSDTVSAKFPSP